MDGWMGRWVQRQASRWMDVTSGQTDEWVGRWMDKRGGGQMGGWVHRQVVNIWTDGWTDTIVGQTHMDG